MLMRHFLWGAFAVPILLLTIRVAATAFAAGLVTTACLAHAFAPGRFPAHFGAIAEPPVTKPAQRKGQRTSSAIAAQDVHQAARTAGVDFRPRSCEPDHRWLGRGSVNPSERPGALTLGLSLAVTASLSSTLHIGLRQLPRHCWIGRRGQDRPGALLDDRLHS